MREDSTIEEVSPYFYSNCFLEALKAKIKRPRVTITKKPIRGTWVPHFEWEDKEYRYDFGINQRISTPLLFRGCLRRQLKIYDEGGMPYGIHR